MSLFLPHYSPSPYPPLPPTFNPCPIPGGPMLSLSLGTLYVFLVKHRISLHHTLSGSLGFKPMSIGHMQHPLPHLLCYLIKGFDKTQNPYTHSWVKWWHKMLWTKTDWVTFWQGVVLFHIFFPSPRTMLGTDKMFDIYFWINALTIKVRKQAQRKYILLLSYLTCGEISYCTTHPRWNYRYQQNNEVKTVSCI